jgi:hypothetical protein
VAPGNLTFTSSHGCDPETDYASGALNTDARAYIDNLLANGWSIRISCIKEGHSADVHGTNRVSLHTSGEAFDIDQINGQTVAPSSLESNRFYRWMKAQPNTALPWEIGGPHSLLIVGIKGIGTSASKPIPVPLRFRQARLRLPLRPIQISCLHLKHPCLYFHHLA